MPNDIDGVELRPFQRRVAEHVLAGRSVVVQTPTGSGKTRAALAPFMANLMRGGEALPCTCRYAVPVRTLANQFHREHKYLIQRLDQNSQTEIGRQYKPFKIDTVSVQTGERRGDPLFESVLTFCTIDQLLAAFLGIPYSVSPRHANTRVAGVIGSYIVFDEWHLFPLRTIENSKDEIDMNGARTTSLVMLRLLKEQQLAPFVLMTATLSTRLIERLARLLGAEVESLRQGAIEVGESAEDRYNAELQEICGGRSRNWQWMGHTLLESVENILALHADLQREHGGCVTLVVCNTVERAEQMYLRLKEIASSKLIKAPDLLLHARFRDARRTQQGKHMDELLGKGAWEHGAQPDAIIVATQVVEVGLNISANVLHTELAPASSLIQRAGRCARFGNGRGLVFVYEPPEGRRPSVPYSESLCANTRDALPPTSKTFTFKVEQELIDRVHTGEDEQFLERFEEAERRCRHDIMAGWRSSKERASAAALIRDVQQVQVIIHDHPETITSDPWRYQAFGMHPGVIMGRWNWLRERQAELNLDWVLKEAVLVGGGMAGDDGDSRAPLACAWSPVANPAQASVAGTIMLVLPTAVAFYDDEIGFAFRDPARLPGLPATTYESEQLLSTLPGRHSSYILARQDYGEHIAGLIRAYQLVLADELHWPARRIEAHLGYEAGTLDESARLLLALHDLGKLTQEWQAWARKWLALLHEKDPGRYPPVPPNVLLAKTDFDNTPGSEHPRWQRSQKGLVRPHHAVEGAAIAQRLILEAVRAIAPHDECNGYLLLRALRTVIAQHHTPDAVEAGNRTLALGAPDVLRAAMAKTCRNAALSRLSEVSLPERIQGANLQHRFTVIDDACDRAGIWMYFLLVRTLRLADQRADFRD